MPNPMTLHPTIRALDWLGALEGFVTLLMAPCTSRRTRTLRHYVSLMLAVATPRRMGGAGQSVVVRGSAPVTRDWIRTLKLHVTLHITICTSGGGMFRTSSNVVTAFLASLTPV